MNRSALFLAATTMLVLLFVLLDQGTFLAPYRMGLLRQHGWFLLGYGALLFANLALAFDLLVRKSFLKDAGRKLHHFDRELKDGDHDITQNLDPHFDE